MQKNKVRKDEPGADAVVPEQAPVDEGEAKVKGLQLVMDNRKKAIEGLLGCAGTEATVAIFRGLLDTEQQALQEALDAREAAKASAAAPVPIKAKLHNNDGKAEQLASELAVVQGFVTSQRARQAELREKINADY